MLALKYGAADTVSPAARPFGVAFAFSYYVAKTVNDKQQVFIPKEKING